MKSNLFLHYLQQPHFFPKLVLPLGFSIWVGGANHLNEVLTNQRRCKSYDSTPSTHLLKFTLYHVFVLRKLCVQIVYTIL